MGSGRLVTPGEDIFVQNSYKVFEYLIRVICACDVESCQLQNILSHEPRVPPKVDAISSLENLARRIETLAPNSAALHNDISELETSQQTAIVAAIGLSPCRTSSRSLMCRRRPFPLITLYVSLASGGVGSLLIVCGTAH